MVQSVDAFNELLRMLMAYLFQKMPNQAIPGTVIVHVLVYNTQDRALHIQMCVTEHYLTNHKL